MNEHDTPEQAVGASLRLRVPPDGRYGKYVRERLTSFAEAFPLGEDELRAFVTAIGEAVANAVEHSKSADVIEVAAWVVDDEKLIATVVDTGVGFAAPAAIVDPELPPVTAERGRGLPIMKSCTDLFTVRSQPGQGTSVILGRYLRPTAGRGGR